MYFVHFHAGVRRYFREHFWLFRDNAKNDSFGFNSFPVKPGNDIGG